MESLPKEKSYCPTCGHVVAKERVSLSSLEFRRLIHKIDTLNHLIDNKERLYRFIKSSCKDLADQFLEFYDLENRPHDDLEQVKLWLLGFINNEDHKEIALYQYLLKNFSDINMPFGEFYDCYAPWVDNPMSKNRVSRALSAFGLKTVMKKMTSGGKLKSTMILSASKEELTTLKNKNGLGNLLLSSPIKASSGAEIQFPNHSA